MKLSKVKQWVKDNKSDIVFGTTAMAILWSYGVFSYKQGARRGKSFLNNKEWALHKQIEIRDLFKDENAKLWIGVIDGTLAYKLED